MKPVGAVTTADRVSPVAMYVAVSASGNCVRLFLFRQNNWKVYCIVRSPDCWDVRGGGRMWLCVAVGLCGVRGDRACGLYWTAIGHMLIWQCLMLQSEVEWWRHSNPTPLYQCIHYAVQFVDIACEESIWESCDILQCPIGSELVTVRCTEKNDNWGFSVECELQLNSKVV
jgi:hypothetical protein